MLQMPIVDGEVGCEHARRDLPTVGAVAHEDVDETGALGREGELDGAAETCGCCFVVFVVAVVCDAADGEVGFGVWGVADGHCEVWR